MDIKLRVSEGEVQDVLAWSEEHIDNETTDHESGSYEEGVHDTIKWMLGLIHSRPDGV